MLTSAVFLLSFSLAAQFPEGGVARLSGQQETLPVLSPGSGTVTLGVEELGEDNQLRLTLSGSFEDLSSPLLTGEEGGVSLRIGYPGRDGGILRSLTVFPFNDGLGGQIAAEDNTFIIDGDQLDGDDLGELYLTIRTERHPRGELRGNFIVEGRESYYVNLFGTNEVPAALSRGYGALLVQLSPTSNVLTVTGSFTGLSDTLATSLRGGVHLHLGLPGQNGPIDISLTANLDDDLTPNLPDDGRRGGIFTTFANTFTIDAEQVAALRAGRYYANIHSGAYLSGELRGQVLPTADAVFRAHLAGVNEYPPVSSDASGQVLAHLTGNTVRVIGSFADLSGPVATNVRGGAHLHSGYAGQNGGILQDLTLELAADSLSATFPLSENVFELDEDQRAELLDRGIYVNIHSQSYPSGEIRGQLLPQSQAIFTAFLNGNQQIPSVTTTGHGMLKVELLGNEMIASGSYAELTSDLNTAILGGAHLHAGYPGQSGPVIHPLTVNEDDGGNRSGIFLPASNTFQIGIPDTLLRRFFYANIHSLDYPGGEIRGSVLAEAERYFLAPLSGASEPQGVPTMATGMIAAEVTDTIIKLVGSFDDLDSDFAADVAGGMHLHRAIAGSNGAIVKGINTELSDDNRSGEILIDSNRFDLEEEQFAALLDREIYVNVHTADYRGGAIRGQVLPLAGSYFHTTFSGANATNYVMTTAQGGLKLELNDTTLRVSGSVTMLDGDFDPSVAGGAHLHLAPAGQNGGIVILLNADPATDLKSARFAVDSNTFELADSVVMALRTGRLYANIHTTTVPSGEARGQIRGELNLPPAMSMILSPSDGDSLNLEGASTLPFRVTYLPTTDPDMDTVIYVWQLATDEDFENVLFGANTGRDTFFSTDFGTVAALLDGAGVISDTTLTLYHRVLASDGSNYTPSEAAQVVIARGDIVGTRNLLPAGFAAQAFPNPARGTRLVTYELKTQEAFRGRLLLFNQLGQLRQDVNLNAQVGTQNIPIDMTGLPAGQYFLTLRNEAGQLLHATRLLMQ